MDGCGKIAIGIHKLQLLMHCPLRKCLTSVEVAMKTFELGSTLQGVVTDWSDAEINGLKMAVGKRTAEKLLKGCKVH